MTQVGYRAGRVTMDEIFALKIIPEKATRYAKFEAHILMMDMSRAIDTVNRKILLQDLHGILDSGELH